MKYDRVRIAISRADSIPDPSDIQSTYQWRILDVVADYLIRYDSRTGIYQPVLAEKWSIGPEGIRLTLRKNLRFHDGSPLTVGDVLATFQRIIRLRRSTHYPIWNEIDDCTSERCSGLKVTEDGDLVIKYNKSWERFFMFLSSPEGSIWSAEDLASDKFFPKRFSGFFYPTQMSASGIEVKANPHSARKNSYPHAPQHAWIANIKPNEIVSALNMGQLDAALVSPTPFRETGLNQTTDFRVHSTDPVTFHYLFKVTKATVTPFNADFFEAAWSNAASENRLVPSFGVLPPGVEGGLPRSQTLGLFANKSSVTTKVRIGVLKPFFSDRYVDNLVAAGVIANVEIQPVDLGVEEFYKAMNGDDLGKLDYLLSAYAASEKFPMVFLELVMGQHKLPPGIRSQSLDAKVSLEILAKTQEYILRNQLIIPLFYSQSMIVHRADMDIGDQPRSEEELQLWKINQNVRN